MGFSFVICNFKIKFGKIVRILCLNEGFWGGRIAPHIWVLPAARNVAISIAMWLGVYFFLVLVALLKRCNMFNIGQVNVKQCLIFLVILIL